MGFLRHIPNAITLINLLAGGTAIIYLFQGSRPEVYILIAIALVADLADGILARALGSGGPFGVQLDSLADMVTFGLLPGLILWQLTYQLAGGWWPACLALVIPAASALRLARYNLEAAEVSGFRGLPTPAMTIAVAGFWYLYRPLADGSAAFSLPETPWLPVAFAWLLAGLMVSRLPLIALKGKSGFFRPDNYQSLLLIGSILLALLLKMQAILPIIFLYILLSCIKSIAK